MKRENLIGRKELGEFCDQFAYNVKIPYRKKNKKIKKNKRI